MPQPEITRVAYAAQAGEQPVVVERLPADKIGRAEVLGLMALEHAAYKAQFQWETDFDAKQIPTYQVQDEVIRFREEAVHGHQLWVVQGDHSNMFDGFIDVGPRRNRTHLHQIHVRPPFKRGLGSRLLHAALTADLWPQDEPFTLAAVSGSSANEFYLSLGMKPVKEIGQLGYAWFITPKGYGLRGIIAALERRRPELARAQLS